jgi:predicted small metal-binding protein
MAARRQARQTQAGRVNDQEDQMRAIDCPCGHRFEAADDEELFRLCREHVDADHPEMQRSDAQIRERVAADAYAVETVA